MKAPQSSAHKTRGATLVEAVIAIGVLSVAIPMVFGTLAESGKTGMSSQAETRATWIIPACMDEIRASREGRPQHFTATTVGQTFPPTGDIWALGFSDEGKPLGKLSKVEYEKGTKQLDGKTVRYIATLSSTQDVVRDGFPAMLRVDLTLEYPAAVGAAKRNKLDFHTRIP
jgi:type II secretory pathway pseudopilin PulG